MRIFIAIHTFQIKLADFRNICVSVHIFGKVDPAERIGDFHGTLIVLIIIFGIFSAVVTITSSVAHILFIIVLRESFFPHIAGSVDYQRHFFVKIFLIRAAGLDTSVFNSLRIKRISVIPSVIIKNRQISCFYILLPQNNQRSNICRNLIMHVKFVGLL